MTSIPIQEIHDTIRQPEPPITPYDPRRSSQARPVDMPSYTRLSQELQAVQLLAPELAVRAATAEIERDMLSRRLQEVSQPQPATTMQSVGCALSNALSIMDEQRRNRR